MILITGCGPVVFDSVVVGGGGVGGVGGIGVVGGGIGVVFGGQPRQWFRNSPVSLSRHVAYFPYPR